MCYRLPLFCIFIILIWWFFWILCFILWILTTFAFTFWFRLRSFWFASSFYFRFWYMFWWFTSAFAVRRWFFLWRKASSFRMSSFLWWITSLSPALRNRSSTWWIISFSSSIRRLSSIRITSRRIWSTFWIRFWNRTLSVRIWFLSWIWFPSSWKRSYSSCQWGFLSISWFTYCIRSMSSFTEPLIRCSFDWIFISCFLILISSYSITFTQDIFRFQICKFTLSCQMSFLFTNMTSAFHFISLYIFKSFFAPISIMSIFLAIIANLIFLKCFISCMFT